MSPNFPDVIPDRISCLLYSFIAQPDQLVQLRFLDFNIYPPTQDKYMLIFFAIILTLLCHVCDK